MTEMPFVVVRAVRANVRQETQLATPTRTAHNALLAKTSYVRSVRASTAIRDVLRPLMLHTLHAHMHTAPYMD